MQYIVRNTKRRPKKHRITAVVMHQAKIKQNQQKRSFFFLLFSQKIKKTRTQNGLQKQVFIFLTKYKNFRYLRCFSTRKKILHAIACIASIKQPKFAGTYLLNFRKNCVHCLQKIKTACTKCKILLPKKFWCLELF